MKRMRLTVREVIWIGIIAAIAGLATYGLFGCLPRADALARADVKTTGADFGRVGSPSTVNNEAWPWVANTATWLAAVVTTLGLYIGVIRPRRIARLVREGKIPVDTQ